MSTTVKGVDMLKTRIEQLSGELDRFDNLARDQPMPEAMRLRVVALVRQVLPTIPLSVCLTIMQEMGGGGNRSLRHQEAPLGEAFVEK